MKWVWDETHRFRMRPHYPIEELDAQCEAIICEQLKKRYGKIVFPVPTEELIRLLERGTQRVDYEANFSHEGGEVDGLTEFRRGQKPVVRIAARVTRTPVLQNRFRMILAHELGHVRFHDFLFQTEARDCLSLFEDFADVVPRAHRCGRNSILPLNDRDWMEWQAGFVCGALLMPIGPLVSLVRQFRHARDLDHVAFSDHSLDGAALIHEVADQFHVSWEAARVRLLQERVLTAGDMRSLF